MAINVPPDDQPALPLPQDFAEPVSHSFVVKVWLENERKNLWRGHITHVKSGRRVYFQNWNTIPRFMRKWTGAPNLWAFFHKWCGI